MFQLRWEESALDELAAIWTSAPVLMRQTITQASHQIDKQLRSNPFHDSESRTGDRRVVFRFPLGVLFRVDGNVVSVLRVWEFRKS